MARLPKPDDNADADHWGALLNEFLRVSHHEDGTLRGTYGVANVKDFGATGNGVTDDREAIQAAIDSLLATGGTVVLPPGTYVINSGAVNITKSHVSLIGSGPAQTTIRYNTNGHGIAVQGGFPNPITHIYIGRLRILSTGPSDVSLAGRGTIAFDSAQGSVSDSVIEDVFIDGTPITGITLQGARNTIRGVWIRMMEPLSHRGHQELTLFTLRTRQGRRYRTRRSWRERMGLPWETPMVQGLSTIESSRQ